jgi:hypothetical protein
MECKGKRLESSHSMLETQNKLFGIINKRKEVGCKIHGHGYTTNDF